MGTANPFILVPVESSPAGADVIVKGLLMGRTPTALSLSSTGTHDIELVLPGYEVYKRRFEAKPGTRIDAVLTRKFY